MVIGDPYKFGIIIERMEKLESDSFKNGIMFLLINGEVYPKDVRTTTFNCELAELLDENSAMRSPVKDKELYVLKSTELFEKLADFTYGKDRDALYDTAYLLPFHEINDTGYSIFIISDGENIRLMVGRWQDDKIILDNEIEMTSQEYFEVIDGLDIFYTKLK